MPYIKQQLRNDGGTNGLDLFISGVANHISRYEEDKWNGMLNYTISEIICQVLKTKYGPDWRYNGINDAVGVLECAKLEFYRRLGGPYEDTAIAKNGDIESYKAS